MLKQFIYCNTHKKIPILWWRINFHEEILITDLPFWNTKLYEYHRHELHYIIRIKSWVSLHDGCGSLFITTTVAFYLSWRMWKFVHHNDCSSLFITTTVEVYWLSLTTMDNEDFHQSRYFHFLTTKLNLKNTDVKITIET